VLKIGWRVNVSELGFGHGVDHEQSDHGVRELAGVVHQFEVVLDSFIDHC